ncbi:MAG: hypothetical protein IH989_05265 [Planctomycetes bacterium]|nr:hypothetical protein [Planctomycetota bacterium]
MKRTIFCGVVALAMAYAASAATACPKHAKAKSEAASLVSIKAKAPCSGAKTVATDGRSENAKAPCSSKKATTVSDLASPCGKNCDKPCCAKGAKTVAGKKGCCGNCDKKGKTVAYKGGCPVAAKSKVVLASLPAIEYRVGDEVTGCSKSAAAMAEESGKPLEYVIGKENFKNEGEAIVRLTALLEESAADMQSVQYVAGGKCGRCPMTAKGIAKSTGTKVAYRVGGVDFDKKEDAVKVAKLVADAVKSVAMTYKVDGKTFHCNKTAGAKCKKSGKKMTYVVGDQETGCAMSAKLMQAQAKVRKMRRFRCTASFSL